MSTELPENWKWVKLGDITTKPQYGWTSKAQSNGNIRYLRTTDLSKGKVNWEIVPFCELEPDDVEKYLLEKDDIVISRAGSVGVSFRIEDVPYRAVFASYLIRLKAVEVDPKFIEYFLKSPDYWRAISEVAAGIALQNINAPKLSNLDIPLPPFAEQKRIVAKLEEAFKHLEILNAKLDRIPKLLKKFRQTVLMHAVTGKLTEEWRQGKDLEEWKIVSLGEVADTRLGKMLDNNKNQGDFIPYLGNINVRWFSFDFGNLKQIRASKDEVKKYELKDGDILVCEGGEPGRAAIWHGHSKTIIFQKALHRVRLNNNVLPQMLVYNLKVDSSSGKLSSLFTGTTIKHLTGAKFSNYKFLLPSLQEQKEIVKKVTILYDAIDSLESKYSSLKEKIEKLPQALLSKAFCGKLVVLDEEDEPSTVSLEKISEDKRLGQENAIK